MSDQVDFYLRHSLKQLTSTGRPPRNARARLLLQAAAPYYPGEGTSQEVLVETPRLPEIYAGYPQRDLSGLIDLWWATRLPLPSLPAQT